MDDFSVLLLPGLGGSGADHWQGLWRRDLPDARIVEQADWDRPDPDVWLTALNRTVESCHKPVVLVAHSLGCALIAHWAGRVLRRGIETPSAPIAAAMLVAPADVDSAARTPDIVRPFAPMPLAPLPFPSLVVVSTDDPYVSTDRATHFAAAWDSEMVSAGALGHISADNGCGPWPEGKTVLSDFLLRRVPPLP